MRTVRHAVSGGALLLLSCGPESAPQPTDLEQLCGTEGPHRLLSLAPGEVVASVTAVGDRLVYVAGPGVEESVLGLPQPAEPSIYSTDGCGNERVVVAEDMVRYPSFEPWPEALLGCRETYSGDLYLLDPAGVAAPSVVLAGGCEAFAPVERGLLRSESSADLARIVLHPFSPGTTPRFEAPVVILEDAVDGFRTIQVRADEVLAIDGAGALVRVGLADGSTTIEQSDVGAFKASSDGRYLVWLDARTVDGDGFQPEGDIFLRDRETGVDTLVAHGSLSATFGADFVRLSLDSDVGQRFVWLPSLTTSDLPVGWRAVLEVADGRWLVSPNVPWSAPFALRDLVTGEQTDLTEMAGKALIGEESLHVLAGIAPDDWLGTGELWRFRYDGSEPELLARRAGAGLLGLVPDGPIVTVIDPDAAGFGRLIAVDPDTLAETVVDERVFARPLGGRPLGDDTILYHVDDGDRSGVWAARMALDG